MKSSNLAWRYEPDAPVDTEPATAAQRGGEDPPPTAPPRAFRRFSLEERAIVIRDQGFRPFRVR